MLAGEAVIDFAIAITVLAPLRRHRVELDGMQRLRSDRRPHAQAEAIGAAVGQVRREQLRVGDRQCRWCLTDRGWR